MALQIKTEDALPLVQYACSQRVLPVPTNKINARRCESCKRSAALGMDVSPFLLALLPVLPACLPACLILLMLCPHECRCAPAGKGCDGGVLLVHSHLPALVLSMPSPFCPGPASL